ncbi:hypothetical protein RvY_04923-2 [Ramazzottius varieornatus]|uniref:Neogenin n=1 Tax=Ramazzottius varieornatus TaxID=947166 RepID=A0A1D1UWT8_RAMVA|nr:hypothetical protein RvY_04923-2 [Ramazzottius varieornatus]
MAHIRLFLSWIIGTNLFFGIKGADPEKIIPFYFTLEPSDVIAVHNQALRLDCSTSAHPEASIQWKRDGIPVNPVDGYRSVLSNGSLFFSKIIHSRTDRPDASGPHIGSYQCSATNQLGTIVSRPAKVQLASLPPFDDEPQDQRRSEGQTMRMACFVPAIPPPKVSWLKDDGPLLLDARMFVLPSGALEISQVRPSDAGSYKCNVVHAEGSKFSASGRLTVEQDPDPEAEAQTPIFLTRPKLLTIRRGSSTTLECAANGFPIPTISWMKNGSPVVLQSTRSYLVGQGNLHIDSVQLDDAGQYVCTAKNSGEAVEMVVTLDVQEPPSVVKKPADIYGHKDSDVMLECEIRGAPEPTIQWLKNGEIVIPSDYFQVDSGRNLRILGLVKSDAGVYQCFGSNPAGTVQASAQLVVLETGASSLSTNIPSAPRDLTANVVNSRFVTLTWLPPLSSNSPVLTYSVYYKEAGSTRERVFNTSAAHLEANIQGLRPSTDYAFRLVAYNEFGPGDSSKEFVVRTNPEVDTPGPVTNLKVYPLSKNELKIEWDLPQSKVGTVHKYKISYRVKDLQNTQEVTTESRQYILSSLHPYTEYAVKVSAVYHNGPTVSSSEVTARTYSDTPTGPPENAQVEPTSANSVTVRWEPPAAMSQNGEITSYRIRYRIKGNKKADVVMAEGVRRNYIISGLERGQSYDVRIAAMNANGTGPPTEWMNVETFRDDLDELRVPGQPASLRIRPTAKSVVVNWSPPNDGNVVVRGYTIGWGVGIPDIYVRTVDSRERTLSIDELEPGAEYVVSVRAFNNMGDGRPTYETVTTKLPSAPSDHGHETMLPPLGLQAIVISESTVILKWTDSSLPSGLTPSDNRFYTVRYSRLGNDGQKPKTIDSSELETPIDGLRPNTMYMFEVRVTKGKMQSTWSLSVTNRTFEAAPSSYPRDLTVMPMQSNPTSVIVNYFQPDQPNGLITGYVIFFTSDNSQNDRDWAVEGVVGDKLTTVIRGLTPNTKYYFKIQARTSKGYGPLSPVVSYTTPVEEPGALQSEDSQGTSVFMLYVIIGGVVGLIIAIIVIAAVGIFCCKRRKKGSSRKQTNGYKPGKKGKHDLNNPDLKPPDLWVHHNENMELKHPGEKSSHEIVPILKHSNEYTNNINLSATLDRLQKRTNSVVDIKNNIDGKMYNDTSKFNSLSRRGVHRPLLIPLDHQSPPIGTNGAFPNNSVNNRPPDSMQRNIFPRQPPMLNQQRLPMIESSPHQSLASPDPSTPSTTAGYDRASSGDQMISGSDTLRSGTHRNPHPLKSFSVPAPPPQGTVILPASGTPRHSAIKQSAPLSSQPSGYGMIPSSLTNGGSPYKRSPMTVSIQNQAARRSPKPPVTFADRLPTRDDGHPTRTFSSEELSLEEANLEALMKDLNAITAASSEFNC